MRFALQSTALACLLALGAASLPARADDGAKPPATPAPDAPRPADATKPADAPKPAEVAVTPASATPPCEPGKADSAKRAVESLFAFAEKGDLEKAFSFMPEPYRSAMPKVLLAGKAVKQADEKLAAAMEAKWGAGAAAGLPVKPKRPTFIDGSYGVIGEKEDGDKTVVTAREVRAADEKKGPRTETFDCRRIDGFWFAAPPRKPGPSSLTPEQEAKMNDQIIVAVTSGAREVEDLATEIAAGKIAKKEDVRPRYDAIESRTGSAIIAAMTSAMPPPAPRRPAGADGAKPATPEAPKEPEKKEGSGN